MEIMNLEAEESQNTEVGKVEKKFIACPADVEVHQKVNLQNAEITEEDLQKFYVRNMMTYSQKTLLISVGHL